MPINGRKSRARGVLLNLTSLILGVVILVFVASGLDKGCTDPVDPMRGSSPSDLIGDYIQVEVLNGCGESGLASTMTDYLRARRFDVVKNGNHTTFDVPETRVLNRVKNPRAAHEVARALGLAETSIIEQLDSGLYVEASVLIGCDYESVAPFSLQRPN
jgi:hypothetical protein